MRLTGNISTLDTMSPSSFSETIELLNRAKAGDPTCLGLVLERYRERLLTRVRLLLGSGGRRHAESGDFLHGVFVKILERFDQFDVNDEGAFLRWATAIARNGIRDDLRKQREIALESVATRSGLGPPDPLTVGTPDEAVARAEQATRLVNVLAEFDKDQQRVIELRHFEQLPFTEIGRQLDRSENAVQLLHTRTLLALKKALDNRTGS